MARLSKAQHHLILVSVAALFCIERVSACPSFEKDYYPVKPQTSNAPYMLNVTDEDGRSVYNMYEGPLYGPGQMTYTISLNGTPNGNTTETFVGFIINVYNEFEDEESGQFVKPPPEGASVTRCHYRGKSHFERSYSSDYIVLNEVVQNSTGSMEWTSFQIKWTSPSKYPAGKITIRASVVKEHGVYWDGITLTLNYLCAMPGCYLPGGCPYGLAKSKFGCTLCECAGAASITVPFSGLLLILLTIWHNLM
ncbi:uncharacterized protein [Montipora capricornis]|uniref:uncharacterized protein isoform X1 n=1 Tax=Montipora capricornis TaxID=246305 RepID=UPI0035F13417